jgi:hypothetical protein
MKKQFKFRHTELVTEKVEIVTTITVDTYEEAIVLLSSQVDNSDLNKHVKTLVSEEEQTRIQEKYEKILYQCIDTERTNTECFENHGESFPVLENVSIPPTDGEDITHEYSDYFNYTFTYSDDESKTTENNS